MRFTVVYEVVARAAWELGLLTTGATDPTGFPFDPFASEDPNIIQVLTSMNDAGQDLAQRYNWQQLRIEDSLDMSSPLSTDAYAMYFQIPPGLNRFVADTMWNRTKRVPMIGPLTSSEWQRIIALNLGAPQVTKFWRVSGDYIAIMQPTAVSQVAYYEYQSEYWIRDHNDNSLSHYEAQNAYDYVQFDRRLIIDWTKLYWRRHKGFDVTALEEKCDEAARRVCGANNGVRTLSLAGSRAGIGLPSDPTVPLTGFAS